MASPGLSLAKDNCLVTVTDLPAPADPQVLES